MKKNTLFAMLGATVLAVGIALFGCQTKTGEPLPPGQATQDFLLIAKPLAEGFAAGMVAKKPEYRQVVCAVADGLDLALNQSELTPEMVDRFTIKLREENPSLDPVDYAIVRSFIIGLYDMWRTRYGPVLPSDAKARDVLESIKQVLRTACVATQ